MSSKHWEIVYIETKEVIQRIPGFLAEEAVLRISLKGNSIQEDDTLSKLAKIARKRLYDWPERVDILLVLFLTDASYFSIDKIRDV